MKLYSSLTNRIFFASAALAILCISTAIYVVNVRVTASAEEELRLDLRQSGAVVTEQHATVSDVFTVLARTVADLPKLKAAVDTDDPTTVQRTAAEYRQQMEDADILLVTDRAGRLLAAISHQGVTNVPVDSLATIQGALGGREGAMFWAHRGGVFQVVTVPITAGAEPPEILGTLSLGFLLDDALANRIKDVTGSEIAFAVGDRIVASTFPAAARSALDPLVHSGGVSSVSVAGDDWVALRLPLATAGQASLFRSAERGPSVAEPERGAHAVAIVLRSRTERLRFLRDIQRALVVIGVVAVLLAIALSYAIARTIARPLAAITAAMREMAATGDLTKKIEWRSRRWEDEDAHLLARTFNTLTDSVARFQREAAERERLSALGRLSTVVAHEVRNPLIIIKASLQPLTRPNVSPDIREAAQDIGEEVARLNRLVNEVLDFARPLRFDFAPTDINRVCEESAEAARADPGSPSIHLALDPSLPPVMTDGERLRSVLVNVLLNARHAVAARASGQMVNAGGAPADVMPDIELKTRALAGGRFAILVRDRGIGIEAAHLPRVFEPYFTTKRTGTGLGLAISRNIVHGLGGTIDIRSEPGDGTEIRIELPAGSD